MSASACIFCKIISGTIPAQLVHQDEDTLAFRDIHPQAKVHVLVIPKKHIASLDEAFPVNGVDSEIILGKMMKTAVAVARQEGLLPGGFRTIINTNSDGGQTVFHLHLHVLGGGKLREKMI